MKILITGIAGFIGYHVAQKLKGDYDIIGIDNLNNYYEINLKHARLKNLSNQNYIISICDKDKLNEIFKKERPDIVIHLAAQAGVRYSIENPQSYIDNNITGFLNILDCCKDYKVKRLLYASSSSVYQNKSFYSVSKKTNELMANLYNHLYGLNITGMRFFTVYGPYGRPDMAYYKFTKNICNGIPIEIYNNGEMSRSFTYIDDITEAISRILKREHKNKIYDIGCDETVSLIEFIETIENELNIKAIKKYLPLQQGDVIETKSNSAVLFWDTGFYPKIDIQTGIKNFIKWYKEYNDIQTFNIQSVSMD